MKYLFLLIILVSTHSFAQKKPVKTAPAKKRYDIPPPKEEAESSPILPEAFAWQINADTTLAPNVVFRETVEINGSNVDSRASSIEEAVVLKKSGEKDYNVEESIQSGITVQLTQYKSTLTKDFLTLTNKETKAIRKFKLIYNKGKKVIRLQDLKTKKFYLPTIFEGGLPSISM